MRSFYGRSHTKDDKEFECIANLSDNYSFDSPSNPDELEKDISDKTNPDFLKKPQSSIEKVTDFITSLEGFIKAIMALITAIMALITASFLGAKQNKPSDNNQVEKW